MSPLFPLASLALAIILSTAAAYAAFNGTSTIASRAQSQFAAASTETSIFDRAAQFIFRAVCPIFRSCDPNDVRIADSQNSGGTNQNIGSAPLPRQAATTVSTPSTSSGQASSPQAAPTSFVSASPAPTATLNSPVVQRVVERIVERTLPTYTIAQGGITEAVLNDRLNQLENKFTSKIYSYAAPESIPYSLPSSGGSTNNIALSQRIDNLDGTRIARAIITDPTISGGNVNATSFSGLLGVGSGGTGTSTAPSYGKLLVGNTAGGYGLLATSSLGISAGGIPGGSDTYVQFNNGDALDGVSSFTFASLTELLTVPFASTTALTISGTASTTNLVVSSLNAASCDVKASPAGVLSCGTDANTVFAWIPSTYGTQAINATSTGLWLTGSPLSLIASSTYFTRASTTQLTLGSSFLTGIGTGLGINATGTLSAESSWWSGVLGMTRGNKDELFRTFTSVAAPASLTSIRDIVSFDNGRAMVVGNRIALTNDYGKTWSSAPIPSGFALILSGAYLGNGVVLIGTSDTAHVYRSTNYGKSWSDMGALGTATNVYSLTDLGNGIVVAGVKDSGIYRSTDYGQTWANVSTGCAPSGGYPNGASYAGNGIVLMPCANSLGTPSNATILRSTNYGATWTSIGGYFGSELDLDDSAYMGNGVFIVGSYPSANIYRSTDYGLTYTLATTSVTVASTMVSVANVGDGVAIASTGFSNPRVLTTYDYGQTWYTTGALISGSATARVEYIGMGVALFGATTNIFRSANFIEPANGGWATGLFSGSVGIGTTSPYFSLTVASSTGAQLVLTDTNIANKGWALRAVNNNFYLATSTYSATSTVSAFSIDPNGIVSIASLNLAACDVKASEAGVLSCGTDANSDVFTHQSYASLTTSATSSTLWLTNTTLSLAASSSVLTFASSTAFTVSGMSYFDGGFLALASSTIGNGTQDGGLTISGGATTTGNVYVMGKVGIGRTPLYQLEVQGSANIYGGSLLLDGVVFGVAALSRLNVGDSTGAGMPLAFYAGGNQGMLLNNAGNLGIGTTSPWAKVSIAGAFNGTIPLFTISSSTASATSTAFIVDQNGNVGIGTTTPSTALQVNGSITPSTSTVFTLGNATYLWNAVYATNGTIQTSDVRLKDNVASTTYGLDQLLQLRPVSYTWKAQPEQGMHLGFIAQEVQPVLPETVSVGDDGNHTMGLTYTEFIPVIVRAIQQLAAKISDLATTIAGFADHFTTKEITFTRAEGDYVGAREINAHERFCIGLTCITESQFQALLASAGQSSASAPSPSAGSSNPSAAAGNNNANTTPPVIMIAGENPAHIHMGDTYNDLGATITAPEQDKNLGIKTYLNGALVSDIVLDTSTTTTDTIDYVVTGISGLTSTSTRTVLIEPATPPAPQSLPITDSPPLVPTDSPTSTATSTSQ